MKWTNQGRGFAATVNCLDCKPTVELLAEGNEIIKLHEVLTNSSHAWNDTKWAINDLLEHTVVRILVFMWPNNYYHEFTWTTARRLISSIFYRRFTHAYLNDPEERNKKKSKIFSPVLPEMLKMAASFINSNNHHFKILCRRSLHSTKEIFAQHKGDLCTAQNFQ